MSTYDGATIKILNWEEYNPRKDVKASSWFRLSHSLFEDPKFFEFEHAELSFWIYILCFASKENSGDVYLSLAHAERIGRFSKSQVNSAIAKLVKNGCISVGVTQTLRARNVDVTDANATDGRTDERNGSPSGSPETAFEEIYKSYPKRKGNQRKQYALKSCLKNFKTAEQVEKLKTAVKNYAAHCEAEKKTGTPFVLQFATFVNSVWEEWVAPQTHTNAPRGKIISLEALP